MLTGVLISESLRPDADLQELGLTATRIQRSAGGVRVPGQPAVWTVLTFEAPDAAAPRLADTFAGALEPGPWYVDWNGDAGTHVVFAGKIFHYPHGDQAGRAEAKAYGREVGVPESQLDWAH